ncbi:MAG: laccase domain-containing protein [Patescibacteria group bacterium]
MRSATMPNIKHKILGKADGNFDPNQPDTRLFIDTLDAKFGNLDGADKFFFPRCNSTNRVVAWKKENYQLDFDTTKNDADGIMIDQLRVVGMLFNADDPTIFIYEDKKRRFFLLHGGFRCLVPELKKGKRERGIIRSTFEDFQIDAGDSKVWVGNGIGPCCYGAEHLPEMTDFSAKVPIGQATRGLRAGKRSVDLYQLIYQQLVEGQKVKPTHMQFDTKCTCCDGMLELDPKYHSDCRSGQLAGRNAVGFWMT